MHNLASFKEFLATPRRIVITTHYKPDADALGSSLAWAGYLRKKGHDVSVVAPSDYPKFLNWMPANETVLVYEGEARKQAEALMNNAELICCLDFSVQSRVQELTPVLTKAQAPKLMVDHHTYPEDFATYVFHNEKAAATCELIYDLIALLGDQHLIDQEIGQCLYAGMMTDTGSFRHPSTTPRVHKIAAELIELGVNTNRIHRNIYDTYSLDRLRFLGFALSQKLTHLPQYRVAYFAINAKELKEFNSQTGDTEGLVNYGLSIEGVVMAVLFVERPDGIKISFRSVEEFGVNEIASTHFNGGGHRNASGGRTNGGLDKTVKKFLNLLPSLEKQLLAV
jgi:phosphoesterase RecJ-like protein